MGVVICIFLFSVLVVLYGRSDALIEYVGYGVTDGQWWFAVFWAVLSGITILLWGEVVDNFKP